MGEYADLEIERGICEINNDDEYLYPPEEKDDNKIKPVLCKKCNKLIMFVKTEKGKMMAFDMENTIVLVDNKIVVGQVAHFETCQFAKKCKGEKR
jgi:hypothetical protein